MLLGFTETHLNANISDSELSLPGYNLYRRDRTTGQGGGVAIYVSNSVTCVERCDLESICLESIWVEVKLGNTSLLVCVVYRPPTSPVEWYTNFQSQMEKATTVSSNVILLGDFNIDFLNEIPLRWLHVYESYGFSQIISEPTRITSSSSTLIDHIYVNRPECVKEADVCKISMSDHYGVVLTWKFGKAANSMVDLHQHQSIKYKRSNRGKETSNQNPSLNSGMKAVIESTTVNQKVDIFNQALTNTTKHSHPISRRVKRPRQPFWFNVDILNAIKLRDSLKIKKNFEQYKLQRNKVVNMIRYAKGNYYYQQLINAKGNSRKLWQIFKEAIGRTPTSIPIKLSIDGEIISNSFEVAKHFNNYFIGVAETVLKEANCDGIFTPSVNFMHFLNSKIPNKVKFTIPHISPDLVMKYIVKLNDKKATGLDHINTEMLRSSCVNNPAGGVALCNIINTSIDDSMFPSLWKIAKVFSLHKGGSRSEYNNYRLSQYYL
jgi:hypothetical protein